MGYGARGLLVRLLSSPITSLGSTCWLTVDSSYSADGNAWADFNYDMAQKRTYRWGEDGIAGVCDTHGRMHIAFAFWNEKE